LEDCGIHNTGENFQTRKTLKYTWKMWKEGRLRGNNLPEGKHLENIESSLKVFERRRENFAFLTSKPGCEAMRDEVGKSYQY